MSGGDANKFEFKQFTIVHGDGAWKVGTDSILLGSWIDVEGRDTVLDVGTGCGILSLMLAQRNADLHVDACEVSDTACALASVNFDASPWANRVRLLHTDIRTFPQGSKYSLIVCNPPYFPGGLHAQKADRLIARQGREFSLWQLPQIAKQHLAQNGSLGTVIPALSAFDFIEIANDQGLYVVHRCQVRHAYEAEDSLCLLELSLNAGHPRHEQLVLFQRSHPTPEYQLLCSPFIRV